MTKNLDSQGLLTFLASAREAASGAAQKMRKAGCSSQQAEATERALVYLLLEDEGRRLARMSIFSAFSPAIAERLLTEMKVGREE